MNAIVSSRTSTMCALWLLKSGKCPKFLRNNVYTWIESVFVAKIIVQTIFQMDQGKVANNSGDNLDAWEAMVSADRCRSDRNALELFS